MTKYLWIGAALVLGFSSCKVKIEENGRACSAADPCAKNFPCERTPCEGNFSCYDETCRERPIGALVGDACEGETDCAGALGLSCNKTSRVWTRGGYVGGYCTKNSSAGCNADTGVASPVLSTLGDPWCFKECQVPGDCRTTEDYDCLPYDTANLCLPLCFRDADCGDTHDKVCENGLCTPSCLNVDFISYCQESCTVDNTGLCCDDVASQTLGHCVGPAQVTEGCSSEVACQDGAVCIGIVNPSQASCHRACDPVALAFCRDGNTVEGTCYPFPYGVGGICTPVNGVWGILDEGANCENDPVRCEQGLICVGLDDGAVTCRKACGLPTPGVPDIDDNKDAWGQVCDCRSLDGQASSQRIGYCQ